MASVVRYKRKAFNGDKSTQSDNRSTTKGPFKSSSRATSHMLHKVLLSGVFILIGLFCWKDVVRNRVWRSRETLFR